MDKKGKKGKKPMKVVPDSTSKAEKKKTCSVSGESSKEVERQKREQDCKELSIRYSLPARMGFWFEDQSVADEKCEEYEKKREMCVTFYQKQAMVHDYLFASAFIEKHQHYLKYGHAVQIKSEVNIITPEGAEKPVLKLSCLINEIQIDSLSMLKFDTGCQVTVSYDDKPIRRNVFTCVSCVGKPDNTIVMYGDDIFIRILDSDGPELFLKGEVPNLDTFGPSKGKVPVYLNATQDRFCKFRIVDPDPEKMITLHGTPVPTFARVAVVQVLTNLMLGVNLNETIATMFSVDHAVECFTYTDPNRRITSENFWMFLTRSITETTEDSEEAEPSSSS